MDLSDLPNIDADQLHPIDVASLVSATDDLHAPRILMLYGSLRETSYSRLAAEEGARILTAFGCEVRTFDPTGLPLPDGADASHPKVAELRELAMWSEGMVWSSPERHGAMTGIMKAQIDWLPLAPIGGIRPTQGKTLAVMQVCGGSQSFNTVNQLRILGRWMRMVTIPNQSSVPMAWKEFEKGRMKPSSLYNRIVDVMEELVRFTYMTRGRPFLTDRYSERVEDAAKVHARVTKL
ncbi:arsenical resistance protein ArsH [Yoonia sp. 208BN28-4]|uniref:arsenical resistance protein ArsH n=1 Tax=Yoonia sp. 208BN28-4 TaxID=3126505 RepID=UPI00309E22C4